MSITTILTIISIVAQLILKAIPFLEEMLEEKGYGKQKSDIVMQMVEAKVKSMVGDKSEEVLKVVKPLAQNLINDSVTSMNEVMDQTRKETSA